MSGRASNVSGIDEVVRNLNREIEQIKGRSLRGMLQATAFIRKDMDKTPPLIPVDTGNLRQSWFTETMKEPGLTGSEGVIMGFSANYAVFVHENVNANFKGRVRYDRKKKHAVWEARRPGAGAKFLEAALKRNRDEILRIIAENAKIQK